jgi:hypothetical protein
VSRLGTQSEIDKLATTLELEPERLAFLSSVSPEELRSLRISIYERLVDLDRVLFERLAVLAARLPPRVGAQLSERVFGPLISARVAAEMAPSPALAIARRVSPAFFADVCAHLDPRRTREMIVGLPIELIVEIARELVRRGEFATMSRFVDFVSDEQTRAVVDAIEDEAAILRVAYYMGSKNRMDHLFQTLPIERVERMIVRVQEERDELLTAFLSVLIHVSYALRRRLADLLAGQDESVLTGYIRATTDQDLWLDVLPVVAGMSSSAKRKVVNLPILREREVQRRLLQAAEERSLWGLVLPLVALMDEGARPAVAEAMAGLGGAAMAHACEAALMGEQWRVLFDLVARMEPGRQSELWEFATRSIGPVDPELLERVGRQAAEVGLRYLSSDSGSGVSVSSAYS